MAGQRDQVGPVSGRIRVMVISRGGAMMDPIHAPHHIRSTALPVVPLPVIPNQYMTISACYLDGITPKRQNPPNPSN